MTWQIAFRELSYDKRRVMTYKCLGTLGHLGPMGSTATCDRFSSDPRGRLAGIRGTLLTPFDTAQVPRPSKSMTDENLPATTPPAAMREPSLSLRATGRSPI